MGDPARLARDCAPRPASQTLGEPAQSALGCLGGVRLPSALGTDGACSSPRILISIGGGLIGFFVAALALLGVGAVLLVAGPFFVVGAPTGAMLAAWGSWPADCAWARSRPWCIGCVNALVWYGRLHLNLLKPAMQLKLSGPLRGDRRMTRTLTQIVHRLNPAAVLICFLLSTRHREERRRRGNLGRRSLHLHELLRVARNDSGHLRRRAAPDQRLARRS